MASEAQAQNLKTRFFDLLRATGIHRIPKYLINFAPAPLQRLAIRLGAKPVLVAEDALRGRYSNAIQHLLDNHHELGDYLEFGVFQGTSLGCMHDASAELDQHQMRLIGFDSFDGLPPEAATDDHGVWQPGAFRSSLQYTRTYLDMKGVDWSRIVLVKGWFSDTLNEETVRQHNIAKASVVMIDCDIYSAAKEALDFIEPLIVDQCVVFFDDWFSYDLDQRNMGEKRAFAEFHAENPHLRAEVLYESRETGMTILLTRTASTPADV